MGWWLLGRGIFYLGEGQGGLDNTNIPILGLLLLFSQSPIPRPHAPQASGPSLHESDRTDRSTLPPPHSLQGKAGAGTRVLKACQPARETCRTPSARVTCDSVLIFHLHLVRVTPWLSQELSFRGQQSKLAHHLSLSHQCLFLQTLLF